MNGTYECSEPIVYVPPTPETIIINVTKNLTKVVPLELSGATTPLVGSIIIMGLIIAGIIFFGFLDAYSERKKKRHAEKVWTTNLTDFEQRPIEQ